MPGCYMIAGPGWKGETPKGIKKVFHSETQFGLVIYRTQLFNPSDINNVKKIQAGYTAQPLSAFLHQPAPPASPTPDFPAFTEDAFKTDFPKYLNFLLQYCPPVAEETALRAKFAEAGIEAGKPFDPGKLSDAEKAELGVGVKEGYDAIEKAVASRRQRHQRLEGGRGFRRSRFLSRRLPAARSGGTGGHFW